MQTPLVNARVSGAIADFSETLHSMGFELDGLSTDHIAHRFVRDTVYLDVLAPEGLGERVDLTTLAPGRTIQVPGGTQALRRTEHVAVMLNDEVFELPRPNLLGAIVGKVLAVNVDDVPHSQRTDLVLLLSLVENPFEMRESMTDKDRKRLRNRSELSDPEHEAWSC